MSLYGLKVLLDKQKIRFRFLSEPWFPRADTIGHARSRIGHRTRRSCAVICDHIRKRPRLTERSDSKGADCPIFSSHAPGKQSQQPQPQAHCSEVDWVVQYAR